MQSPSWLPDLNERFELSKIQCFSPPGRRSEVDPITGRIVAIVPARQGRHSEHRNDVMAVLNTERSQCLFCRYATPSTLLMIDQDGSVNVPRERDSIKAASRFLEGPDHLQIQTFYDLVNTLAVFNAPSERYVARVFRNLTPSLDLALREWCTVTALNPSYHEYEFHDLPTPAMDALVKAWQVQEELARAQSLSFIGFLNGGKRRESGQSVACCHGQSYAVKNVPGLYSHIQSRRESVYGGRCPICTDLLTPSAIKEYGVWCPTSSDFVLLAHPAPLHNWSMLIVPRDHVENISEVNASQFSAMIQAAIRALRGQFGVEPAFNIVVRSGGAIGHMHAEIVPRTNVNILAGWEIAGHEVVITIDPRSVPLELSMRIP